MGGVRKIFYRNMAKATSFLEVFSMNKSSQAPDKLLKHNKSPSQAPFRAIPIQQIPANLHPLVITITKLEKSIMTTKNAVDMNFDHIIDLLVNLKRTALTLIEEAKQLEKSLEKT